MSKKITIVFFGTSDFAVPALELLVKNNYIISSVITSPDEPVGRKQTLTPPPIKITAQKLNLNVLQPESLKLIDNPKLLTNSSDLGIVASYGKIIPQKIIESFSLGILNIHPSLLPKYRGPSPIQYTLLNGEEETGATIMKIDDQVDHGPILINQKLKIENQNFKELHDDLAKLGAELLIKILPDYISGKTKPREQNHDQATFTKMIKKEDGKVDWQKSAEQIYNQFRAFFVWPGIWTVWNKKVLKITACNVISENVPSDINPGKIIEKDNRYSIKCGDGFLGITRLQIEGGKEMLVRDFITGHKDFIGSELE